MPRRLVALLGVLSAFACGPSTAEPYGNRVDDTGVALQVSGSVRTQHGDPVVGAPLAVQVRQPVTCTGSFPDVRAITDAAGDFSCRLWQLNSPLDVCLLIAVVPPVGTTSAPTTVYRPARLDRSGDTLVVDIILPAPPEP